MLDYRSRSLKACSKLVVLIGLAFLCLAPLSAQNWPKKGKSIQMWIGYGAGSATDVGARIMAAGLEQELGVPVIPVNKPGASSQIMYSELMKTKPDGYTFGTVNFPSVAISVVDPARKATYTKKNFVPLARHVIDPGLIAVATNSPFKTLADLIAAAKANPGKVTISTSGIQSAEHFELLQIQELAGVKFAFVHFSEGSAMAIAPLLGGKLDAFTGNVGDVMAQYKAGQVRILGIMDTKRSVFYPEAPTFMEQGINFADATARGYILPAGTPRPIVEKLSAAIKKVMDNADHIKKMQDMALTISYLNPDDFSTFWTNYEDKIRRLMPLTKE